MRIVKARAYRKCKNGCDIWLNDFYYPQKKHKALCLECGRKRKFSFIKWLLGWLSGK